MEPTSPNQDLMIQLVGGPLDGLTCPPTPEELSSGLLRREKKHYRASGRILATRSGRILFYEFVDTEESAAKYPEGGSE